MLRTILILAVLVAAILWLPLWAQLILLCVAIIYTPYRLALFVPAVLADVLYAPRPSPVYMKMTLVVAVLLILWWIITKRTRILEHYA